MPQSVTHPMNIIRTHPLWPMPAGHVGGDKYVVYEDS